MAGAPDPRPRPGAIAALVAAGLCALALLAFLPALQNGFTTYDDPVYVTGNPHVRAGVSLDGLRWAITSFDASNWHPLTWISHQLDATLFGDRPLGHHLTSVLLHALNAALLFALLRTLTGALWRAAAVAALFAVHPLRVESVAWISERKDVLSTLFLLLTCLAYVRAVRSAPLPSLRAMVPVLLLFVAGLAAKPMLVTLPFVLLLLDAWPLDRVRASGWPALVREKVPLVLLAAAACVVTYLAQAGGGSVMDEKIPFGVRAANAIVSYVVYLRQMVAPVRLAAFYPHPVSSPGPLVLAGSLALLAALTAAAWWQRRARPWLLWGWLFYLGTLVPVIGLVQVGLQARADRYTYVPLVGIFVAVVWLAADLAAGRRHLVTAAVAFGLAIAVLVPLTWAQARTWRSGVTLWTHALAVTPPNSVASYNLGFALQQEGRHDEALAAYEQALRLAPNPQAHNNAGAILRERGDTRGALAHFTEAARLRPEYAEANANAGILLLTTGTPAEALVFLERAAESDPSLSMVFVARVDALARLGRWDRACPEAAALGGRGIQPGPALARRLAEACPR